MKETTLPVPIWLVRIGIFDSQVEKNPLHLQGFGRDLKDYKELTLHLNQKFDVKFGKYFDDTK